MTFIPNIARFSISGSPSEDPTTGDRGYDVLAGATIALTLERNPAPVLSVTFSLPNPADEDAPVSSINEVQQVFVENSQPLILLAGPNDTVHIVVNAATELSSYVIRCTVVDDVGTHIYERIISVREAGLRMTVPAERQQYSSSGWSVAMNEMALAIAGLIAGSAGLIVGGAPSPGDVPSWNGTSAVWVTPAALPNIATDSLLGRDAAGSGPPVAIAIDSSLAFTGSNVIQRAALTGAVTAAAGSNVTALAAGVVGYTNLANIATDTLIGRDTVGTGVPEAISLNTTLEFTGAGQIQRAALSGDVTAAAGSNVLAITAGAITLSKFANINTDKLLGRDTAGAGPPEEIALDTTLGFNGSGSIQRSALTGDVTASAGSNTTVLTNSVVTFAKMANIGTDTLIGRDTVGSGVPEAITLDDTLEFTGTGQIQRAALSGAITAAAGSNVTALGAGVVSPSNLAPIAGLSVIGNGTNASATPTAITGTDGLVLRVAGTTLAFGTIVTAGIADSAVTIAKLANATASSVLGRSAATGGAYADIVAASDGQVLRRGAAGVVGFGQVDLASAAAVTGLLPHANIADGSANSVFGRAGNTSGVMAPIAGTDGQVLRVAGTTLGFGAIVTTGITDGNVTLAKLANATASSVLGRSAATGGVYADIASSADGQVLRRGAAGVVGFGQVDLASANAITGLLPHANIANLAALSVFGRGSNSAGVMAAITGVDGQILRVSGTTLAFGSITTAGIADGSITLVKLADATASSVLGRSAATTGPYADIASSADGQVLRRGASGVIAFGQVDLASANSITGLMPHANIANLAALSVFGRSTNTAGVMAAITGADGQVLRVSGTTLGFGTVVTAGIADSNVTLAKLANATASSVLGRSAATGGVYADIASSADGQVLRRGASGVIAFGQVDLASANAVTGLLPVTNLADLAALSVLGRSAATSGPMAAITGVDGQILRVAGTTLAFGTITTAGIADGSITLAKLANATASSVLGRSAASGGVYADIASSADGQVLRRGAAGVIAFGQVDLASANAVTGLLPVANLANLAGLSVLGNATNASAVMSAITGTADLVLRVNAAGTALAFGAIATGGIANSAVTLAKIADGTAASVLGRAAATTGAYADIASASDGQVLRRSGTTLSFGAVDLASANATTGVLPFASITNIAGLSVLGRTSNTTGAMAAITGVDGQVLRVSGTALSFGTVVTAGIADGNVTLAKLANATASSVLGRSAATTGVYADITSSADGQVLRRGAAGVIAFGTIDLASANAVSGLLPYANIASLAGLSVLGRSANSSGVMAAITGTADQVLRVDSAGTTVGFGTIATAGIANSAVTLAKIANGTGASVLGRSNSASGVYADIVSTLNGQVLVRAGGSIIWGAIDLADTDAVSGLLSVTNIAPSGTNGRLLTTLAGVTAWSASVGNSTDAFTYNGASHSFQVAGTSRLDVGSAVTLNTDTFYFLAGVVSPNIGQQSISTAAGVGQTLLITGQFSNGTGATQGGSVNIYGGQATGGTGVGGAIDIRSGVGSTALKAGNWQARLGNTIIMNWAGAEAVATAGTLRMPSGGSVIFRNLGNTVNISGLYIDSSDNLVFGDAAAAGTVVTGAALSFLTSSGAMTFSSAGHLNLFNSPSAPSSNPSSGVYLYCIGGELWVRGGSGTVKKLAEA